MRMCSPDRDARIRRVASSPSISGMRMSIEHDVRPVLERGGHRLLAVRGLRHDRDARRAQDQPEPAAHQQLIIGDDHARGLGGRAHVDAAWNSGGTGRSPATGSSGILAVSRQPPPGRGPASSSPP